MNWGVRIAAIILITGGLVWVNMDRGSESTVVSIPQADEDSDVAIQKPSIDRQLSLPRDDMSPSSRLRPEQGLLEELAVPSSSEPKKPEFVLQHLPSSLNDSDSRVRSVADELSPEVTAWLQPAEQVRKWVLLFTQAAEGKIVYQDRPFLLGLAEFEVEEVEERFYLSVKNFERYHALVTVLENLPVDKLIAYYRAWYPLLEEAFGELGLPGAFDERFAEVLDRILAVNVLVPPIELKKSLSVTYKYRDPELEGASQLEKMLWRMGPQNTIKIQDIAYRIKRERLRK